MSIRTVVTRGYGSFGSIDAVTVRGFLAESTPPSPPPATVGGAGATGYDGGRRRRDPVTARVDYAERERIAAELRDLYREIVEPPAEAAPQAVQQAAGDLVAPFAPVSAPAVPSVASIDWAGIAEDAKALRKIRAELAALVVEMRVDAERRVAEIAAAEAERRLRADDEEAMAALLTVL